MVGESVKFIGGFGEGPQRVILRGLLIGASNLTIRKKWVDCQSNRPVEEVLP
jgi:hypothetical protein